MKIACYTDIHVQETMLNLPTVLRRSAVIAAENTVREFGKVDLAVVGGDTVSDYPHWDKSCALPYRNWLDIKQKVVENFARTAAGERVLYVNGNNDLILGDLPTAENPPYNTAEFYHSGPMKQTLGELAEGEYYGKYCASKGEQAGLYHLVFHYVVNGVDFFGINIDPDTAFDTHEGYYNRESLRWLGKKLDEIDPDGNRPIFVVGHLSYYCRKYDQVIDCRGEEENEALFSAFQGHRNLFYLYGHVHGMGFVNAESANGVLHIGPDHKPLTEALHPTKEELEKSQFTLVHMGGLRPFQSSVAFEYFQPDGLTGTLPGIEEPFFSESTGTPRLAQYLVIESDEEKVTFTYRNTGDFPGYSTEDLPSSYTVTLKK